MFGRASFRLRVLLSLGAGIIGLIVLGTRVVLSQSSTLKNRRVEGSQPCTAAINALM